jgi:hypothetical protein
VTPSYLMVSLPSTHISPALLGHSALSLSALLYPILYRKSSHAGTMYPYPSYIKYLAVLQARNILPTKYR